MARAELAGWEAAKMPGDKCRANLAAYHCLSVNVPFPAAKDWGEIPIKALLQSQMETEERPQWEEGITAAPRLSCAVLCPSITVLME